MFRMEPLGIGVVGAGSIGIRGALAHLVQDDIAGKARAAAVCDPVEGRAEAAAERFGVPGAYRSLEELLADPAVDAVTICSPIGLHYEQVVAAIDAGKHVHVNKTMTVTADESLDLIARAKDRGVRLVASPGQMVRPVNRIIRDLVRGGGIGQFAWAAAGAAFETYHEDEAVRSGDDVLSNVNPSWYWRKPGGGPLYDMTVYALHTLTGVLGPALRVTAMSGVRVPEREWRGAMYPVDADDNTGILIDFGGGAFAFAHGTVAGTVSEFGQPSFFGTTASIVGTALDGRSLVPEDEPFYGPYAVGAHAEIGEGHVFQDLMSLVDWVRDDIPSDATAEHAAHVVEIIEAAYRAAATGETQTLRTTFPS
jgi:predicted dehydrogenase